MEQWWNEYDEVKVGARGQLVVSDDCVGRELNGIEKGRISISILVAWTRWSWPRVAGFCRAGCRTLLIFTPTTTQFYT